MPLTFVTSNAAKARELGRHLKHPVIHRKLDLTEIQSLDLEEIVRHKAEEALHLVEGPVLIEDASLTFHAWGHLPGPLIKHFLSELSLEQLAHLLDSSPDRSATAEVLFGYHDGKKLHTFRGVRRGSIALHPRGPEIFGWDPLFVPLRHKKTWAEMNEEEQSESSMRRPALLELAEALRQEY